MLRMPRLGGANLPAASRALHAMVQSQPNTCMPGETVNDMLEREHKRWLRDKARRDVARCRQKFDQAESLKWMRLLG